MNSIRSFLTIIIGALSLLIAIPSLADSHIKKIRIASEGAYPPFNLINDNGEMAGYDREVGDEICKRAKLECTWTTNDWDSIIPNLLSGNYDVIIAAMTMTKEREKIIDFTQEYYPPEPSVYIGLANAQNSDTLGIVAAQTGTVHAAYVAESSATVIEFATPEEIISAVRSGEADAAFADLAFFDDIVRESQGRFKFIGKHINIGSGIGIAIRESDKGLKDKFDKALSAMKQDGTLNRIIEKWFDNHKSVY